MVYYFISCPKLLSRPCPFRRTLSCDIHTQTPAHNNWYKTSYCTQSLSKHFYKLKLAWARGMGMSGAAHTWSSPSRDLVAPPDEAGYYRVTLLQLGLT